MKWILYDAWGVIYTVGDDVQTLLRPYLQQKGFDIDAETLAAAYAPARDGQVGPEQFWASLGLDRQAETLEGEYLRCVPEIDPGFRPAAESLAGRYRLAMLSNCVGRWSQALRRRFGLEELLEHAIVSAEVGLSKPDPAIYQYTLRRLGCAGGDCVFIDDRPRNLRPAAAAGIRTILFARDGAAGDVAFDAVVRSHDQLPAAIAAIFQEYPPMPSVRDDLARVGEFIRDRHDPQVLADARRRHAAMLAGRECDYLPILLHRPCAAFDDVRRYDWAERFDDPDKSLLMQLLEHVVPAVSGDGDCVPGVRADTGVVNCMSVLGAGFDVPAHTRPVVTRYVPKDELAGLESPSDIRSLGTMPRVIEHTSHHRAVLAEHGLAEVVTVYHCDQQGPFDIAAQSRGHEIFIDLYDDPPFVHRLMEVCVDVYAAVTRLCKNLAEEPMTAGNAVGIYNQRGGVRMCGDSDILVSREQFAEFIAPYQQRALEPFGGGWLHYCGGVPDTGCKEGLHLHDLYAGIKGLRGLNFTTAGDWVAEARKLAGLGVANISSPFREADETLEAYFRRALGACDRRWGLLLYHPPVRDDERDGAADLWRSLQDELLCESG